MEVHRLHHGVGGGVLLEIEVRHLGERVNPGVGATRALDQHALAAEAPDRLLQGRLHRGAVGLALPADEVGAVILDGDLRSEEHTSELQSLMRISYAVFCLKQKKKITKSK